MLAALRASQTKRESLTQSRHKREIALLQSALRTAEESAQERAREPVDSALPRRLEAASAEIVTLKHRAAAGASALATARQELADARGELWTAEQASTQDSQLPAQESFAQLKQAFAARHAETILRLEETQTRMVAEERASREAAETSA